MIEDPTKKVKTELTSLSKIDKDRKALTAGNTNKSIMGGWSWSV